jgi:hypothetical protein
VVSRGRKRCLFRFKILQASSWAHLALNSIGGWGGGELSGVWSKLYGRWQKVGWEKLEECC